MSTASTIFIIFLIVSYFGTITGLYFYYRNYMKSAFISLPPYPQKTSQPVSPKTN